MSALLSRACLAGFLLCAASALAAEPAPSDTVEASTRPASVRNAYFEVPTISLKGKTEGSADLKFAAGLSVLPADGKHRIAIQLSYEAKTSSGAANLLAVDVLRGEASETQPWSGGVSVALTRVDRQDPWSPLNLGLRPLDDPQTRLVAAGIGTCSVACAGGSSEEGCTEFNAHMKRHRTQLVAVGLLELTAGAPRPYTAEGLELPVPEKIDKGLGEQKLAVRRAFRDTEAATGEAAAREGAVGAAQQALKEAQDELDGWLQADGKEAKAKLEAELESAKAELPLSLAEAEAAIALLTAAVGVERSSLGGLLEGAASACRDNADSDNPKELDGDELDACDHIVSAVPRIGVSDVAAAGVMDPGALCKRGRTMLAKNPTVVARQHRARLLRVPRAHVAFGGRMGQLTVKSRVVGEETSTGADGVVRSVLDENTETQWVGKAGASVVLRVADTPFTVEVLALYEHQFKAPTATVKWCADQGLVRVDGSLPLAQSCSESPLGAGTASDGLRVEGYFGWFDPETAGLRASIGLSYALQVPGSGVASHTFVARAPFTLDPPALAQKVKGKSFDYSGLVRLGPFFRWGFSDPTKTSFTAGIELQLLGTRPLYSNEFDEL